MRRRGSLVPIVIVSLAFLSSCGGGSSSTNPFAPPGSTAVSLTMGDTPPAGVTVLSFEIAVTGAVLQPGNVSLLNSPVKVEITQLETETAFLNTVNAPANQPFSSIDVTFANPEITILNDSGGPVAGCANGQVCELKPALNPAKVSFSGPPFPLTLSLNSPIGLLLDFNLNASIQNDLSVNPTISFTQLPALAATGKLEELEDITGKVSAKDAANNQFTLQLSNGQSLTVKVDTNTEFKDFDKIGLANNFSSLAVNQIVEVDLNLMSGGMLVAKEVELQVEENEEEDEGVIVSVDSPTQFKIVVLEEAPDVPGIEVGNVVTVTLASGAEFRIDNDGLTVPSDATFNTSADLVPGQMVEVRRLDGSSGASILTDRVTLKTSQFTARVTAASTDGITFKVGSLPSLLTGAGITEINVLTSSATDFDNVSGATALQVGDTVSLRGLLFKTTGIPNLVAKKVRKR